MNPLLIADVKRSNILDKLDEKTKFEIPCQNNILHPSTKVDFEKYLKDYKTQLDLRDSCFKSKSATVDKIKLVTETEKNIDVIDKKNYLETPLNEFRKFYNSTKRPRRKEETTFDNQNSAHVVSVTLENDENKAHSPKVMLNNTKNSIEVLNQSIITIRNTNESINNSVDKPLASLLSNESQTETKNTQQNQIVLDQRPKSQKPNENLEASQPITINSTEEHISSSITHRIESQLHNQERDFNLSSKTNNENIESPNTIIDTTKDEPESIQETHLNAELKKSTNYGLIANTVNKNLETAKSFINNIPKINVEDANDVNVTDVTKDIESININNRDAKSDSDVDEIQPQMTIIVSPKITKDSNNSPKSHSSEQAAKLTQNDDLDAIVKENDQVPDEQIDLEASNLLDGSVSDIEKEYGDNFSADVDNYNSKSEYELEVHSPVSILKTSDDENFWD